LLSLALQPVSPTTATAATAISETVFFMDGSFFGEVQ
jgi:hypothetical protein